MAVGKLHRYGLPFSNVAANNTATNNVTPGRTLEVLRLRMGGTFTKANIPLIRMRANGKTLIEGTGARLDAINAYRGIATAATFMDLFFADYAMNNELDRMVGAFDTSLGISNITTEVQIGTATSPTLTPIVIESGAQKAASGEAAPFAPLIAKILRYPFNIATGGRLPVTVPFGPQTGSIIKRVHVFHGGNMTGAIVRQDGLVIHESVAAENQHEQGRFGRVPQTNCYTIDFVVDGNIRNALDTRDARSLEWLFDFSAADSGEVYVEYLDPLGNL